MLRREIADPGTQWSLGTFGAIAEFSRDEDEPAQVSMGKDAVSAVTQRGGIVVRLDPAIRPFASESINKADWNQRIALCLPEQDCAMNRRGVLTEIGTDAQALRSDDRDGILFDLGLGALQADFCVRIDDEEVAASLRRHAGRPVFEPGNPAMGIILQANPHRVFVSKLGRIEVYQPIPPPSGKSPDGPHTHVLPKLLKSGRTHPATEPVPAGWIPCAHLYPEHPARDGFGRPRAFEAAHLRCIPGHAGRVRRPRDCRDQAARAGRRPRRAAARGVDQRSPWPHQHSCGAAANEGRRRCFAGAVGMASKPRSG